MRTLVIIPTFEEAATIRTVLTRTRDVVPDADILVVDDASPDGTAELAAREADERGRIHLLRRGAKHGLGPAYLAGFRWALERGYDVVVEMDADLSHDPDALPRFLDAVETRADFVVGSRIVDGGSTVNWPWYRRALSRWGNRYVSWLLHLPVRDATSGFRAIRREILEKIDLDHLRSDGYAFQVEMIYRMVEAGATGLEIPITFTERAAGRSKMSARIVAEALLLVTAWGLRDRLRALTRRPIDA